MAVEIERKFLLADASWRAAIARSERIAQGYLVGAQALHEGHARASVRVRRAGERAWLNIKSATLGIERAEFEYPVPLSDAEAMLSTLCDGVLEKRRHHVEVDGTLFEIDEFLGDNAGLVVAEIELAGVDEAFARPDWLGAEATHAHRYYNLALASRPYSQWSEAERGALDLAQGR